MSRTDKDAPWWVRSEWHLPEHYYCQYDVTRQYGWHRFPESRKCDLPVEPEFTQHRQLGWRKKVEGCVWEPEWPFRRRYRYTRPPSKKEKRNNYWGPDRSRVRAALGKARQEHQTLGEVVTDCPVVQHKHGPISGGWWD